MVNKIKRLFWKIQDFFTNISVRFEIDFVFNVIHTILLIIILIFVIFLSKKFYEIEKIYSTIVRSM